MIFGLALDGDSNAVILAARPDLLAGPGGVLDLTNARYEQVTTRSVRVSGAVVHSTPYAVKLEGARKVGYKTIFIGTMGHLCCTLRAINFSTRWYPRPSVDRRDRCVSKKRLRLHR